MLFKLIFFIVVLGGGGYLIFKIARKAWRKADVDQKMEDIKVDTQMYDKVKDVDMKEVSDKQKAVNDFAE